MIHAICYIKEIFMHEHEGCVFVYYNLITLLMVKISFKYFRENAYCPVKKASHSDFYSNDDIYFVLTTSSI